MYRIYAYKSVSVHVCTGYGRVYAVEISHVLVAWWYMLSWYIQ